MELKGMKSRRLELKSINRKFIEPWDSRNTCRFNKAPGNTQDLHKHCSRIQAKPPDAKECQSKLHVARKNSPKIHTCSRVSGKASLLHLRKNTDAGLFSRCPHLILAAQPLQSPSSRTKVVLEDTASKCHIQSRHGGIHQSIYRVRNSVVANSINHLCYATLVVAKHL